MIFEQAKEAIELLMEGSKKAIPFNVILASLLAIDLTYHHMPFLLVGSWLLAIIIMSLVRWIFCRQIIKKGFQEERKKSTLRFFFILTLIMGIVWGSCYFISLPYLTEINQFIIILVFGGMCAGSIASLSVYLPAYYAYIVPMFLPIILYNYSFLNTDRTILATMFLLFIVMLLISAKINKKLLDKTFQLSYEKESLIRDLQTLSITDSLTGLYNRRHFEAMLLQELNRAKRNRHSLNLIFMDIDNFKLINDNFGHPFGDKFLMNVGEILKNVCRRSNDILFRVGGDEFAVLLINQPLKEALSICQLINVQLKNNILKSHFSLKKQSFLNQITLSMGMVNIHFEFPNIEKVLKVVDKALYQAKNKGKNQIIVKKLH